MSKLTIQRSKALLSTGEFVDELRFELNGTLIYESSPVGSTLGQNEVTKSPIDESAFLRAVDALNVKSNSQELFDHSIPSGIGANISTPLSLGYLRLLAERKRVPAYKHIADYYETVSAPPRIICNVLNGGKHAGNGLQICEFMIIPLGKNAPTNISIASEVYLDLQQIIALQLGAEHTMVGREGGFAPNIDDVIQGIGLLEQAIAFRNANACAIALDVAANNFSKKIGNTWYYQLQGLEYTARDLVQFYKRLLSQFPMLTYLEDPFNEDDKDGWRMLMEEVGEKILVVADDLTVTNAKYIKENVGLFNAIILKTDQIGTFSGLYEAYSVSKASGIKTIISQRSGETDSSIIAHIAVGLGSDYLKAGAPARERIIKYNELLRIAQKL